MIAGLGKFFPLLLLAVHSYGHEETAEQKEHLMIDPETGYSKAFLNGILNIKSAMLVKDSSCFTHDSTRSISAVNPEERSCKAKSKNSSSSSSSSCWPTSLFPAAETLDHLESETEKLHETLGDYDKDAKITTRKVQSSVNDNDAAVQANESQNDESNDIDQSQDGNQPQKSEGILNTLKAHLSGTFNALANGTGAVGDNNSPNTKSRKKKSKKNPRKLNNAKLMARKMARKRPRKKQRLHKKKVQSRREDFMDETCVASPIDRDTCQKP